MKSHLKPIINTVQDSASQFIVSSQIANSLSIAHLVLKLTTTGSAIKQPLVICFYSNSELSIVIYPAGRGDLVGNAMQLAVKYLHRVLKHVPTGVVTC